MSERLRAGESGTEGVRRIIRRQIRKALEVLCSRWPLADDTIHEARKRLKKGRAALRLVRKALGSRVFRRENRALRDAARPLSEIRDAKILIETFDGLVKDVSAAERRALSPVRSTLVADHRALRRRVLRERDAWRRLLRELRSARKRASRWPIGRRGWSVLGPGLRRGYRAGRRAFVAARQEPTVENLHEWRKQAKYLWHQLEILEPLRPSLIETLEARAHRLSDHLGSDHDLAVLQQRLEGAARRIPRATARKIRVMIERRRKAQQLKAMVLGGRVYEERPRAFVKRLEGYWRLWRSATRGNGRSRKGSARPLRRGRTSLFVGASPTVWHDPRVH